jgi:hypothetical protein
VEGKLLSPFPMSLLLGTSQRAYYRGDVDRHSTDVLSNNPSDIPAVQALQPEQCLLYAVHSVHTVPRNCAIAHITNSFIGLGKSPFGLRIN